MKKYILAMAFGLLIGVANAQEFKLNKSSGTLEIREVPQERSSPEYRLCAGARAGTGFAATQSAGQDMCPNGTGN